MSLYYTEPGIEIHHSDNLELMHSMPSGDVDLIYSDILYNTGKDFKNYNDNLGSPWEAVEWYRPRIEQMKRVLAEDGSIFIHCNWRLDSYMRILMDEIFGEKNFHNRIYRKHSNERGFYKNFDSQMDVILYYLKDPANFKFKESHMDKKITTPLFEDGLVIGRSEERMGINLADQNKHWLISPKQMEAMLAADEFRIIDGLPYRFSSVKAIGNLWAGDEMLDTYSRSTPDHAYDTPKPDAVLEQIITTCSNPGDKVADFFMGGGTTADVAKKLKRRFIGCDISEKACEVTVEKLQR